MFQHQLHVAMINQFIRNQSQRRMSGDVVKLTNDLVVSISHCGEAQIEHVHDMFCLL